MSLTALVELVLKCSGLEVKVQMVALEPTFFLEWTEILTDITSRRNPFKDFYLVSEERIKQLVALILRQLRRPLDMPFGNDQKMRPHEARVAGDHANKLFFFKGAMCEMFWGAEGTVHARSVPQAL